MNISFGAGKSGWYIQLAESHQVTVMTWFAFGTVLAVSMGGSGDPMKLEELVKVIDARMLQPGRKETIEITNIFASDKMSALLAQAGPGTLLVTGLANTQLTCVAELMDCPALCLVDGVAPDPGLLEAAAKGSTAVLVCPFDMFETCGRLHRLLYGESPRRP
jgi:hypothetical protein